MSALLLARLLEEVVEGSMVEVLVVSAAEVNDCASARARSIALCTPCCLLTSHELQYTRHHHTFRRLAHPGSIHRRWFRAEVVMYVAITDVLGAFSTTSDWFAQLYTTGNWT